DEHALQAVGGDTGHDAVQRLPVHVHHPDDLPQLGHAGVDDGLPDGTLVELGVTQQRVLAAGALEPIFGEAVVEVAPGHRAPDRRGRADADGSGRVVDRVGILDAAGV